MHLHRTGPEDRATILFIHGAGVAGWMWKPQMHDLSQDYHCLVPDLPGHGQNPADERFSLERSVEGIAEIIHQYGERTHIVGLSMGGTVALALLATYPQMVDHAMISAPAIGPMPRHLRLLVQLFAPLTHLDFVINQNAKALNVPDEDLAQFRQNQKRLAAPVVKQINETIHGFRILPALTDVSVPTLVMVGQREMRISHQSVQRVVETMPNATGRVAPGVGHGWNSENPQLFNQTLRAWIEGKPLPDSLSPLGNG